MSFAFCKGEEVCSRNRYEDFKHIIVYREEEDTALVSFVSGLLLMLLLNRVHMVRALLQCTV